mmetsp:Transcript_64188/g.119333  ORF Transcript_64188/g.119333 Transcript_64188/m.119333 type:complete len:157 (-) Transcript_64188:22-492(-)
MAWLQQKEVAEMSEVEQEAVTAKVMQLASELLWKTEVDDPNGTHAGLTVQDLHAVQDDWYGTLSGGQRTKAEFISQVFLHSACPPVLLLDEAFAALDPESKRLVQRKLKEFCSKSLILVVHHSDAGRQDCIESLGFFDANLHFASGTVQLRDLCDS